MSAPARPDQLLRLHSALAAPGGQLVIVNVPIANYLMLDGSQPPGSAEFHDAIAALLELSTELRMFAELPGELFGPMPVDLLWPNADDPAWDEALATPLGWTAMTLQPSEVTPGLLAAVRDCLPIHADPALVRRIRFGSLREGLCAQTLVTGTLDGYPDLRRRFLAAVRALGYEPAGPQHEIHLASLRPNRRLPIRSILRQPIRHVR